LQFGILFSAAFALWFSVIVVYGYWKRWFASIYECEVGWEELFVLELYNEKFSKGKKIWGYVSGTYVVPKNTKEGDVALIDAWEANNAKIITWINNSVEHSIGTQLAKYETIKEVWDHLQKLFTQSNFAKQNQLENDIRALHQKNMSIQEFYSAMTDLWDQLALTESAELKACGAYIKRREYQWLVQFLTALHGDFEGLRGSILHRSPLPFVDLVVSELLVEEICL